MNHEDVQREAGRAHGRMRDVRQNGVGGAGVEEQAKAGEKDENPRPGKRRYQYAKEQWKTGQHRRA